MAADVTTRCTGSLSMDMLRASPRYMRCVVCCGADPLAQAEALARRLSSIEDSAPDMMALTSTAVMVPPTPGTGAAFLRDPGRSTSSA